MEESVSYLVVVLPRSGIIGSTWSERKRREREKELEGGKLNQEREEGKKGLWNHSFSSFFTS